jgi:NAD(P)-dependent dehydrogenase (short-subunit alcohol dehydrogenase family)
MAQQHSFETVNSFRLDGKISLVTGASRGLGLAIAEALAGAGSDIVINARGQGPLESVAKSIREKTGRQVLVVPGDISSMDFIEEIVHKTIDAFGRIDVLVNNAGTNIRGSSSTYTVEDWDQVIGINLKAVFFLTQACANKMIERGEGGKVINILSLASSIGLPGIPAYAAAKGGMTQVTKTLAVEWAPHNIQVNGIGPGFFQTSLSDSLRKEPHRNQWILSRSPSGRWGQPVELTGAAVFFASSASNFVTGQVMYVDGGFLSGTDWRKKD